MIDHNGNTIHVGYLLHELEWLKAANQLPEHARYSALIDIASMSGRQFNNVRHKANEMRRVTAQAAAALLAGVSSRRVLVPSAGFREGCIKPPTVKRLMGAR